MSGFSAFQQRKRPPSLPLMPLIDIIFLILIFFVINVNLPPGGIEIDLPSSKASRLPQEQGEVIVSLNEKGEIFLNNENKPLDQKQLRTLLQPYRINLDKRVFRLRADRRLAYGQVISVLDVLAQVSENISLETVADDAMS